MKEIKEMSVTRDLKKLLNHKKIIRKITKYYDRERRQETYRIYLKRGCISCYSDEEIGMTEYDCTGNIKPDAKNIDDWLDEILYTQDGLTEAIEHGNVREYLC